MVSRHPEEATLEVVGGGALEIRADVTVAIERRLDALVPEAIAHDLRVDAGLEVERRFRVAELVEGDVPHAGRGDERVVLVLPGGEGQEAAVGPREDEVEGVPDGRRRSPPFLLAAVPARPSSAAAP